MILSAPADASRLTQPSPVSSAPFASLRFFRPPLRSKGGRVLQEIAEAHGATPRQVALRFLLRWPSVFAIPKAADPAHVAENAASGELRLGEAELARIEDAFPLGPRPRRTAGSRR